MVSESEVMLPAQLRISDNAVQNLCDDTSRLAPAPLPTSHPFFSHFAARFPISLAAGFGLPPFFNQSSMFTRGGDSNLLEVRNRERDVDRNGESNGQRKRRRHAAASLDSDDSACESHFTIKGRRKYFIFWCEFGQVKSNRNFSAFINCYAVMQNEPGNLTMPPPPSPTFNSV